MFAPLRRGEAVSPGKVFALLAAYDAEAGLTRRVAISRPFLISEHLAELSGRFPEAPAPD